MERSLNSRENQSRDFHGHQYEQRAFTNSQQAAGGSGGCISVQSVCVMLSSSLMYSKGILQCVCGNAAQERPSRENALQILVVSGTAQLSGSSWQRLAPCQDLAGSSATS